MVVLLLGSNIVVPWALEGEDVLNRGRSREVCVSINRHQGHMAYWQMPLMPIEF